MCSNLSMIGLCIWRRQVGHCRAAGVPLKRKYAEFRVTPDAMLPVGTPLTAAHFVAGQYVDVQGDLRWDLACCSMSVIEPARWC